jgi:predicted DNA-binding WGR domain protein
MSAPDFRDTEPVWVKYAELIGGGHDKFYEVTVHLGDDGTFYLQKRWGRRPDAGAGQIQTEPYKNVQSAISNATAMLDSKLRKGYRETERPYGASNKVYKETGPDYYAEGTEAF